MPRWLFRPELEKLDGRTIFYLDPASRDGVDHRLYREYGRAPRGKQIYQAVVGKRRARELCANVQAGGRHDQRTPIFLNPFFILQFDFQDNPLKNVAVSIAIGRQRN